MADVKISALPEVTTVESDDVVPIVETSSGDTSKVTVANLFTSPTLVTPTLGVATATSINFGDEALSVYDEGTFTPDLQFGGAAVGMMYSDQTGFYTKIGDRVFFNFNISLTAKGSSTGDAVIAGLPFTSKNVSTNRSAVTIRLDDMTTISSAQGRILPNTTSIVLEEYGAGNSVTLTHADFMDTSNLVISGHYLAA